MFESEQKIVNSLRAENKNFERLYNRHCVLKQKVNEANKSGVVVDRFALEQMKKEKLLLKDQMAAMIYAYQQDHVSL